MQVGDVTRHVISHSKGKRPSVEVVYKTFVGKHAGKPRFTSKTKHEFGSK